MKSLDGPSGTEVDFTDLHAWARSTSPAPVGSASIRRPAFSCGEGHLPLAATPHYSAAAPISGAVDESKVEFDFEMTVTRVEEKPRITLPFSDEAWEALVELGDKVDVDLTEGGVALTMGGEPTFVSIDDYEAAEWNTAAVGPTKRTRADDLSPAPARRFAPAASSITARANGIPAKPAAMDVRALLAPRRKAGLAESGLHRQRGRGCPRRRREDEEIHRGHRRASWRRRIYVEPAFEDPAHWIMKEARASPRTSIR